MKDKQIKANDSSDLLILNPEKFDDVKVLWIDIDQTLLDFDRTASQCMEMLFEHNNLPFSRGDYENYFLPVNRILWPQVEQGLLRLDDLHKLRWHMILERAGLAHQDVDDFERQFRILLDGTAVPVPGALQALTKLALRYPVFIVTNGPLHQQIKRLDIAGMLEWIRDVYASSSLKASKPDAKFFLRARHLCEKKLGRPLKPQQIAVIGDSLYNDIDGAAAAGMPSVLISKDGLYAQNWQEHECDAVAVSWQACCELFGV